MLRMVERIGFLICLLTHLTETEGWRERAKEDREGGWEEVEGGGEGGRQNGGRVNDETVRQADGLHTRLPIIFFLKVADGDETSTTTNSKLVFCK